MAAAGGKTRENQTRTQLLQSNLERQQNQVYYTNLRVFRIKYIFSKVRREKFICQNYFSFQKIK